MESLGHGYNLEIYNSPITYDGKNYDLPMVCAPCIDDKHYYTSKPFAEIIDASTIDMSIFSDMLDLVSLSPWFFPPLYFFEIIDADMSRKDCKDYLKKFAEKNIATVREDSCEPYALNLKDFVPDVDYSKVTVYSGVNLSPDIAECLKHYVLTHKLKIEKCPFCGQPFIATHGNIKACSRYGQDKLQEEKNCREALANLKSEIANRRHNLQTRLNSYDCKYTDNDLEALRKDYENKDDSKSLYEYKAKLHLPPFPTR